MTWRTQLARVLPRPLVRRLRWLLGWVYWSKAVAASLLPAGHATLRADLPAGALDCIVARNEHGVYCVPRSCAHKYEAQTIIQSRVWEPETLAMLRELDPDGDIVHAGAFFGDFLPALARSRRSGAIVWAFEPNRESYRCAQITTMLNDLSNVVLTHAALAGEGGATAVLETHLRTGLPRGGGSYVVKDPSRASGPGTEEVDLVSIDGVVGSERRVAVIQLDVERHEQEALAGAMLTIERCRPVIMVESLPEEDWLARNLASLGYQRDGSVLANKIFRPH